MILNVIIFLGLKGHRVLHRRSRPTAQRISMKTILHGDCLKDKKDTFDETVAQFLNELDEECLMSVHISVISITLYIAKNSTGEITEVGKSSRTNWMG